jgi:hypothetical protein
MCNILERKRNSFKKCTFCQIGTGNFNIPLIISILWSSTMPLKLAEQGGWASELHPYCTVFLPQKTCLFKATYNHVSQKVFKILVSTWQCTDILMISTKMWNASNLTNQNFPLAPWVLSYSFIFLVIQPACYILQQMAVVMIIQWLG